jgi:hypothetical protein
MTPIRLQASIVGVETYDSYARNGVDKTIRGIRIGRDRWRMEFTLAGVYIRMGDVSFAAGFDWADE